MQRRPLGASGIQVSALAFGAGPISGLMTGDAVDRQTAVLRRAYEAGVNWIDTAATYGAGQSERSIGLALHALGSPADLHVATKVRLVGDDLTDLRGAVRRSLAASLERLGLPRVTLLQLHNSLTARRDDEPTSLTPDDFLGPQGILAGLRDVQADGLVRLVGLTAIGQPAALRTAIEQGGVDTIQVPYHLLNPSAGQPMPAGFREIDYGELVNFAGARKLGVLAIRVYAGGALLGQSPSPHTLKTPFFPLALFERDSASARRLAECWGSWERVREIALRFALDHPHVSSAIVGFGEAQHVDDAVAAASAGPLPPELLAALRRLDPENPPSIV